MKRASIPLIIPFTFIFDDTRPISKEFKTTRLNFLRILVHKTSVSVPFETYPEDIYVSVSIHERHDSYLFFIESSLTETQDELASSLDLA